MPLHDLSEDDIDALGARNFAEVVEAFGPLLRSGRGQDQSPVYLLNGRRITGFSEVSDLPPEAIIRLQIFPEEVALQLGYRADQRVLNIVLRPRFRAVTGELEIGGTTRGGRESYKGDSSILRLSPDGRWNVSVRHEQQTQLLESERDLVEDEVEGASDGRFRTLLPESERYSVNATFHRALSQEVQGTLNARVEKFASRSLLGRLEPVLAFPITRSIDALSARAEALLAGYFGEWRWSAVGSYDRASISTRTHGVSSLEEYETDSDFTKAELFASGSLGAFVDGPALASFRLGYERRGLVSDYLQPGAEREWRLRRNRPNAQVTLDLPVARRNEGSPGVGNLSITLSAAIAHLSDFGTLRTLNYGVLWSPLPGVIIRASVSDEDGAPSMQQLGNPQLITPGVPVFDFRRGETRLVDQLEGGNPALVMANRMVRTLAVNLGPFNAGVRINAEYSAVRVHRPIALFLAATPEMENAFPTRFRRDAEGRLTHVDTRPLNFASSNQEQLRTGFVYSNAAVTGRSRGDRQVSPAVQTNVQAALYHTWRLRDETLVGPAGPVLDLLNGSAAGNRGGRPRHEMEFTAVISRRGLGARVGGVWQSATTVLGAANQADPAARKLFYSNVLAINLGLFADLGQLPAAQRQPWLRNMRVGLGIDNLLDRRPQVRTIDGATPLGFQAAYLDPLGRSVRITLRKLFRN